MRKIPKLSSFWIRIIALLTMTIDHVGVFLDFSNYYILRVIGRLALPLFVFLTVEGALKTHNKRNYFLRMLYIFLGVAVVLVCLTHFGGIFQEVAFTSGNIFLDLLLVLLSVWILESENKKIKPLILLPVLYSIFSYTVIKLEGCGCDGLYMWFYPPIRMQYGFYSILLGLGFYYATKLTPKFVNKYYPINIEDENFNRVINNIFSVIVLVFASIILMLVNMAFGDKYYMMLDGIQTYAIISSVFILLYNGKKGYSSKWFRIAYYLYYPLHIGIISLFFL